MLSSNKLQIISNITTMVFNQPPMSEPNTPIFQQANYHIDLTMALTMLYCSHKIIKNTIDNSIKEMTPFKEKFFPQ